MIPKFTPRLIPVKVMGHLLKVADKFFHIHDVSDVVKERLKD